MSRNAKNTPAKPMQASVADDLVKGLENAIAYARGARVKAVKHVVHVPKRVEVHTVRAKLGLSQAAFAARFGVSPATVRNWEQGRRKPEGPARVLLTLIDREPQAVERALAS
jgi:putative transcriptional regulator